MMMILMMMMMMMMMTNLTTVTSIFKNTAVPPRPPALAEQGLHLLRVAFIGADSCR